MNDTFSPSKKSISFDILFIGVVSLLAVGSWVVFDVYRSFTKTAITKVQQKQIKPLKSKIDPELIDNIRNRRRFNEVELSTIQPKAYVPLEDRAKPSVSIPSRATAVFNLIDQNATPTAAPIPAITPEATQSGEITL